MSAPRHCDDYINDFNTPKALRWWLFINRLPATQKAMCNENGVNPSLYADYKGGQRVRVTMASRMGDLGINRNLMADHGYDERVAVSDLTNFGTIM